MANDVFANGREVACKAADGKAVAAFPDVCFTPPQTPATPPGVPIPYPNTGFAKDTSKGSKKVKISGKEVMLKNKSYFKKSTGDEAGRAPKKGVITSKITGKVFFNAWSMNVKIEGQNVVRHLDLTTHNHGSTPGNSPPWTYTDTMTPAQLKNCKGDINKEQEACGYNKEKQKYTKTAEECCNDNNCQEARKCMLSPYGGSGSPNCCKGKTGHHLLPNSLLQSTRNNSLTNVAGLLKEGPDAYNVNKGACVCVEGSGHSAGEHGDMHEFTKIKLTEYMIRNRVLGEEKLLKYEDAKRLVVAAHNDAFKDEDGKPKCKKKCLEAQIDESLKKSRTKNKETGEFDEIDVRPKDGCTRADHKN